MEKVFFQLESEWITIMFQLPSSLIYLIVMYAGKRGKENIYHVKSTNL